MTTTSEDSGGVPTEGDLDALFEEVKNWGRWGWDDEKGTLNHATPARTLRAISLVRTGRVVSTAFDLDTERSAKNYFPTVHMMLFKGFERPPTAADQVTIVPHSFTVTHLDAVSHSNYGGVLYNGRAAESVVQRSGLRSGSVLAAKDGIVTRGVLLDIPASLGRRWLEPDEYITEADLDAAAEWAGLKVGAGDVVLVRSGLGGARGRVRCRGHRSTGRTLPRLRTLAPQPRCGGLRRRLLRTPATAVHRASLGFSSDRPGLDGLGPAGQRRSRGPCDRLRRGIPMGVPLHHLSPPASGRNGFGRQPAGRVLSVLPDDAGADPRDDHGTVHPAVPRRAFIRTWSH